MGKIMQIRGFILVLTIFLMLSPLFSQVASIEENQVKATEINADYESISNGLIIKASVLAYSNYIEENRNPNDNSEKIKGNQPVSKGAARTDVEYIKGATINVYAYKNENKIHLCSITTNKYVNEVIPVMDKSGNYGQSSIDVYYGECVVHWPNELKDSCFRVVLEYKGGNSPTENYIYKPSSKSTLQCFGKGGVGTILASKIDSIISKESKKSSSLCLPTLILFGLLVAGLYSRGLTLFGIMDILTPKPPKLPDIKYSYSNYSPHSTAKDEFSRAVKEMELRILPMALKRFLKERGSLKAFRKKRLTSRDILEILAKEFNVKIDPNNVEEAISKLRKATLSDENAKALLDLVSLYESYKGVIASYGERKKISGPLKGTKKFIDSFSKPFSFLEVFGEKGKKLGEKLNNAPIIQPLTRPLHLISHGAGDALWAITRNAKAAHIVRMSPLLAIPGVRKKIRHRRVEVKKKIDNQPKKKIINIARKAELLVLGGEEPIIGKLMNPEKEGAYYLIREEEALFREVIALKLMDLISSEIIEGRKKVENESEIRKEDSLRKLLERKGLKGEELVKRYNEILENPLSLFVYFENPIGGKGVVGAENPEVFLKNIEDVLGAGILDEISKDKFNKILGEIEKAKEIFDGAYEVVVNNFSKYDRGEISAEEARKNFFEEIKKHEKINKVVMEILDSPTSSKEFEVRAKALKEMWGNFYTYFNGNNGKLETISERYVKSELTLRSLLKSYSALGVEFALFKDKKDLSYGSYNSKYGEGVYVDSKNKVLSNKDAFFINLFENAISKKKNGFIGEDISFRDIYVINAIEFANFGFGFYAGEHILKQLPDEVFAGMGYSAKEFKEALLAYSERYKVLFLELAKNKEAEKLINRANAVKVIDEYLSQESKKRIDLDSLTKEKFLDIYYNPTKYGVEESRLSEFKKEFAKSIEVYNSAIKLNSILESLKLKGSDIKINAETANLIRQHLAGKGIDKSKIEKIIKDLKKGKRVAEKYELDSETSAFLMKMAIIDSAKRLEKKELLKVFDVKNIDEFRRIAEINNISINVEELNRNPVEYLFSLFKEKHLNENIKEAIANSLVFNSAGLADAIFSKEGRNHNDKILKFSKPWDIDWNFISAPFIKSDFGKFSGSLSLEKFLLKQGFKKKEVKSSNKEYRKLLFWNAVENAIESGKFEKNYALFDEFIELNKRNYEKVLEEIKKIGFDEKVLNKLKEPSNRRDRFEFIDQLFNLSTKEQRDALKKILLKNVDLRESTKLVLTGTPEASTRKDYNTTIRKTALLEFLYNRFNGEVEFDYSVYKKYLSSFHAALLDRNGEGRLIDSAAHFSSLTNNILRVRNYSLAYMGIDLNNEDQILEGLKKYDYKKTLEELEKRNFALYKEDIEKISWGNDKELGYVPNLMNNVIDIALLPENTAFSINQKVKEYWQKAANPLVFKKRAYVSQSLKNELGRIAHEYGLLENLTPQSRYPVNYDYAVVQNGMMRKFLPEKLTESQTEIVKLQNKWGTEFNEYAAEVISRFYKRAREEGDNKSLGLLLNILLSVSGNVDKIASAEGLSLGLNVKNIEEIAFALGAKTPNELLNILGRSGFDNTHLLEVLDSIENNPRLRMFKFEGEPINKVAEKIRDKISANKELSFDELRFLIRFDSGSSNKEIAPLSQLFLSKLLYPEKSVLNEKYKSEILSSLLKNLNLTELLNVMKAYYSSTKNYDDKVILQEFLSKFEERGEYMAAAKYAFELSDETKDDSFMYNLKGLLFGSHERMKMMLNKYGADYMERALSNSQIYGGRLVAKFLKGFMKGTLLKNMITYNGVPFARGAIGALDAFGSIMTEITWQTYGKEIEAERRIFHATEMAKATNQRIERNIASNEQYKAFFEKVYRDINGMDITLSSIGNPNPLNYLKYLGKKLSSFYKLGSIEPFDVTMDYLSNLIVDGSTITREMGLTYGGIDSSKRDGKIGSIFHIKSSLGSTNMFSVLGTLGYSAPGHRTVSPWSSSLLLTSMLFPFTSFLGTAGLVSSALFGGVMSGAIPSFFGRMLYKTKSKKWGARLMRFNIEHLNLMLASGTFYSLFTGPILGLATFTRHYMFPSASDVKAAGYGDSDFASPKRQYATTIPRPNLSVRELYEKPLIHGAPILGFILASSTLGLAGGLAFSTLWGASSFFKTKLPSLSSGKIAKWYNRRRPGRAYERSWSEELSRKISSTEHVQMGSSDEIKYRRAGSLLDFAGWYSHKIGMMGGLPVNPGQSYVDFYTGQYKTEPWIHHYISGDPILKNTMASLSPSDKHRIYDMFSRYNTSNAFKVMQSWKDVYGYGPTEAYMWWVMSPALLGMWLGKRMEEYSGELRHVWKGAKILGYDLKFSDKINVTRQAVTTFMYGMGAPIILSSVLSPITTGLVGAGVALTGAGIAKTSKLGEDVHLKSIEQDLYLKKLIKEREEKAEEKYKEKAEFRREHAKLKRRRKLYLLFDVLKATPNKNMMRGMQRCPRCGAYKPAGGVCPNCNYNPRKDFEP